MRHIVHKSARCFCAVSGSFTAICLLASQSWAQENAPPPNYVTLLGIHSATVAPHGLIFANASTAINLDGDAAEEDSTLALGFGLGNADDNLGVQFTASGTSSTENFDSFGYFGVKASRRLRAGASPIYVGLAADRLGAWGEATDIEPATTLAFTRFSSAVNQSTGQSHPVMMTIGAGTHVKDLSTEPGVFLGAGAGLSSNFGASAAWNGDSVDIGAAFKLSAVENIGFTALLSDAFNQDGRQQLSIGVSWYFDAAQRR